MKSFYALVVALLLASGSVFAQEDSPDALIKKVTDEVLTIVRQDKDIQNGNTKKAIELIEVKILPNFNFQRMTALAVGRDWNKASPEQKKRLAEEFRTLLVRTYSNALTSYKDQTLRYKPGRSEGGEALVRTEVVQPGGKPIQMDYALEKQAAGWKVYDVDRRRREPGDQLPRHLQSGSPRQRHRWIDPDAGEQEQTAGIRPGNDRTEHGDGAHPVRAPMLIANARALLEQGRSRLRAGTQGAVVFNLAAVEASDSSALSVVFAWARTARENGVTLRIVNPPASLLSLAALYGVSESLPLA